MAALTHNTNYIGEARGRLLEQFKNKPRVDGLLVAFMTQVQLLEDAMYAVFIDRLLQGHPTGGLLDKIGIIVGQPRITTDDAQQLVYITARIRANRSDGRHETLIDIVSLLTGGLRAIVFRTYLKALEVEVLDINVDPYLVYNAFLFSATVAGDNIRLFFSTQISSLTLTRSSVSGGVTTVLTQRKGSVHGTYGGGLFGGVF